MYRTLASCLPHNNRERVKHIGVGIVIGGKQNEAGRKQVQNWESVEFCMRNSHIEGMASGRLARSCCPLTHKCSEASPVLFCFFSVSSEKELKKKKPSFQ